MTERAVYQVEISWENYVQGIFTLDQSVLSPAVGPNTDDVLAADFGTTLYDDISSEVKSIEIKRGRSADFGAMDAGACTLTIHDPNGKYNPRNRGTLVNHLLNPTFGEQLGGVVTNPYVSTNWTMNVQAEVVGFATYNRAQDYVDTGAWSQYITVSTTAGLTASRYVNMYHDEVTAAAGQVWSGQARLYCVANAGVSARLYMQPHDGAMAVLATYNSDTITPTAGQWATLTLTNQTMPAGTVSVRFGLSLFNIENGDSIDVRVDSCQLEQAAACSAYVDGDLPGGRWDGTPHASATYMGAPLYGKLQPLRPLRVRATYSGTTQGLFHGYITRISHDPHPMAQETVIEATDMFERIKRSRVAVTAIASGKVGKIVNQILENSQIPSTLRANVSTAAGHTVPSYSAAGSTDMLSEIETLLTVDRGTFFIDGDGVATYRDTSTWYSSAAAAATFDGLHASKLHCEISVDGIINQQTVTAGGTTAQTYTNSTSVDHFGYCAGSPINSTMLANEAQALSLATFMVDLYSNPRPPAQQIELLNSNSSNMTQILTRELGDIVTVSETRTNTALTGHIEMVDHQISAGGGIHRCQFAVRERPSSAGAMY